MAVRSVASLSPPRLRSLAPPIPGTAPLVSVIIVNYRRWDETAALVDQLLCAEGLYSDRVEVLVIDNASPAHALEDRLRNDERVRLHRRPRNRGFSAGVNAGYRLSRGRWLLVLNADLQVPPEFLDMVCATALDLDSPDAGQVGVVGFQLRNRDGSHQLSTGFFPSFAKMVLGLMQPRTHRKYLAPRGDVRHQVPWVTGSCLLVRRACLRQLGGFDEEFFLYYEDVDLCLRAQAEGWSVCYEPSIQAVHLDPLQNRRLTEPMRAVTRHASLTYFRKHLSGWQFQALGRLVRAEAFFRQRWHALRGRREEAAVCGELSAICRSLLQSEPAKARRRLDQLLGRVGMGEWQPWTGNFADIGGEVEAIPAAVLRS